MKTPENSNNKSPFKFKIGQLVEYVGTNRGLRKKIYKVHSQNEVKKFLARYIINYCVHNVKDENEIITFSEDVLKAHVTPPVKIQDVDELTKRLQRESGIKSVETITYYNLSRAEARKLAFEALKKTK